MKWYQLSLLILVKTEILSTELFQMCPLILQNATSVADLNPPNNLSRKRNLCTGFLPPVSAIGSITDLLLQIHNLISPKHALIKLLSPQWQNDKINWEYHRWLSIQLPGAKRSSSREKNEFPEHWATKNNIYITKTTVVLQKYSIVFDGIC